MCSFVYHHALPKEIKQFSKKHRAFGEALERLQKLLCIQFDPSNPTVVMGAKSLHHIQTNNDYGMWKVICATEGLKRKQSPRIYFAVQGLTFFLLCMDSHGDNYDDAELRALAFSRVEDLIL